MSKFYNETIQTALYDQLHKVGMPRIPVEPPYREMACGIVAVSAVERFRIPTYAYVLDWLMGKGMCVSMYAVYTENQGVIYISALMDLNPDCRYDGSFGYKNTWEEAITTAIEKAIELLKEK